MTNLSLFFTTPADASLFFVCGFLCSVYFIVSSLFSLLRLGKDLKGVGNQFVRVIFLANLYSLLLSTPLMPFILGASTFSISLFALSNFLWQHMFLRAKYEIKRKDFFVTLSLIHIGAWGAMALTNYWFYLPMMRMMMQ